MILAAEVTERLGSWFANPLVWCAAGLLGVATLLRLALGGGARAKLTGRLLALSIGLALALVAAEIATRTYIDQRQGENSLARLKLQADLAAERGAPDALIRIIRLRDDDLLQFDLMPGLSRPYKGGSLRTNSVGMCDEFEYPVERTQGTLRIVGLGDSGMFGWGVPHDGNYMAVLEESLNGGDAPLRYEVLNFAIPAINTRMEEEVFLQKARAYAPDLVVVGWCVNDTSLPNLLVQELALRRDRSYLWMLLTDRPAFDGMLTSDFGTSTRVSEQVVSPALLESVGEDAVIRSFERLAQLGEDDGFDLFVFGPMEAWIADALDELGIARGNTRELVDAASYPESYKVHEMHPSAEGHAVLAGVLEAELRARGFLEPGSN